MIVTLARPQDLDLAVPPLNDGRSGMTLQQIMRGYPNSWTRAANAEYRDTANGVALGLIATWGTVHAQYPMSWPTLYCTGTRLEIGAADMARVRAAWWAVSAGPWLIRAGGRCYLDQEIRAGGYTGLREYSGAGRAGIGIRRDGMVVHIAHMSTTLAGLTTLLERQGCVDAIALDGGGSVGVIAPGKTLLGHTARQVGCALVFRQLDGTAVSVPTPTPDPSPKTDGAPIICLDAGHGGRDRTNRGAAGYVEADGVLDMVLTAGQVLRSHGLRVIYTRTDDRDLAGTYYSQAEDLAHRAAIANAAKADLVVSVHTNAAAGRGTETYHYPGSVKGPALATAVQAAVVGELGRANRGVKSADFAVLRLTSMPAALTEIAFHDNGEEERLLLRPEFRARAGYAVATGILTYLEEKGELKS